MKKKWIIWVLAIILLFFLFNFEQTANLFKAIGKAIYPVFIGVIFAFILNSPIKFFENTIFSSPKIKKFKRMLSLSLTLILFGGLIALAVLILAPEIDKSLRLLKSSLPTFNAEGISSLLKDIPWLSRIAGNLDKLIESGLEKINKILPQTLSLLARGINLIFNLFMGLVFGCLIIYNKELLARQFYQLILYFSDEIRAKKVMASWSLAADKFSKFLSGQFIEAFIFGGICYLVFTLFKLPYAALAAFIMAVGNLIPMLGAYISGAIAFMFIFTVSVEKALVFAIVIVVLQQVEQLTTYPIIVGRYVGISSFWILFAVIVGGGLFGFWGLVLAVPIVAFIDNFFNVLFERKMKDKTV